MYNSPWLYLESSQHLLWQIPKDKKFRKKISTLLLSLILTSDQNINIKKHSFFFISCIQQNSVLFFCSFSCIQQNSFFIFFLSSVLFNLCVISLLAWKQKPVKTEKKKKKKKKKKKPTNFFSRQKISQIKVETS